MEFFVIYSVMCSLLIIAQLSRDNHAKRIIAELDAVNEMLMKLTAEKHEYKKGQDEYFIGSHYRPAIRGSENHCNASIPANGVLYRTENNGVAWLKVRSDGFAYLFTKMADTGNWEPIRPATMFEIGDCIASKIPDDAALAIKSEEYQKQLSSNYYSGEQMIKTYSPL